MIDWHHLLGVSLTDYFTGSCYKVEMEKELSLKKQRLDILIIEQEVGSPILELPDGLENLARHNLMTYKSLRQPLDAWALDELIGHYVNYRKQISPSFDKLLPAEGFGLYAVCTRPPEKLEAEVAMEPVKEGVYDLRWGSRLIRLIVLSEVPPIARNALWLLFSGVAEKVHYGFSQYKSRQRALRPVLNNLFASYQLEGIAMPYTVEDFKREVKEELLASMTPEERLQGLPPEARLQGLPPEALLKRLNRKQIEAYLKKLSARKRARKRGA